LFPATRSLWEPGRPGGGSMTDNDEALFALMLLLFLLFMLAGGLDWAIR
jgi:hypothetical protein